MMPILYSSEEYSFASNGLGRLSDCTRCEVTEERNGMYVCEFDMPVTSGMYSLVQEGRYIGAIHDDKHDVQPFMIYARSAPINGVVTFYANHISYKLKNIILKPFTATSCAQALARMQTETYNENPFTFWTDKNVNANFKNVVPASCRSMLAGQAGSILDVYGTGEYEYDKWAVKLYLHRGQDNGVSIRYGVNLLDIRHDTDISDSFSAVAPYYKSEDGTTVVTLPEGYVVSPNVQTELVPWTTETGEFVIDQDGEIIEFATPNIVIAARDFTGDFEDVPTVAQLRQAATDYLANNSPWMPKDNITVSFVDMAHTEDYKDVAALQRVSLCDYVNVYCGPLGVDAVSMQVIRTVYNTLSETYNSIELGTAQATYADTIMENVDKKVNGFATSSDLESAIEHSTQLITGGLGGYVVFNLNADGEPQEILIMDTPDKQTAVNVWRFNQGGLGHSHNGYNGPFNDVALTADGKINATMITTGVMLATLIKAGVLSAANNSGNYWNLETGEFVLTSNGATDGIVYRNGVLHINGSNIDVGTITANIIKAGILQDAARKSYWNMLTGAMRVVGTFSASVVKSGHTYTMELSNGELLFKRDGTTFGSIAVGDNSFELKGAAGMDIAIWTHTQSSAGASLTLNSNGDAELSANKLTLNSDIYVYGYEGYSGYVNTVDGQLQIENGIIVNYIPDT